jgi:hypothetical protein
VPRANPEFAAERDQVAAWRRLAAEFRLIASTATAEDRAGLLRKAEEYDWRADQLVGIAIRSIDAR